MDKKVVNEEQFKKLVIKEAEKIISEGKDKTQSKRKITFDNVESLIKEMEGSNKSITSIDLSEELYTEEEVIINENIDEVPRPNRDLDVNEHNRKKNINHLNEGEREKWNRMMNYKVPSDDER